MIGIAESFKFTASTDQFKFTVQFQQAKDYLQSKIKEDCSKYEQLSEEIFEEEEGDLSSIKRKIFKFLNLEQYKFYKSASSFNEVF